MVRRGIVGGLWVAAALLPPAAAPLPSARAAGEDLGPRIRVTATWPKDGSLGVFTDPVVVRFRRPVDLATATVGTFQVSVGSGPPLAGSYDFAAGRRGPDLRTVVFTPSAPIPPGASCRVLLGLGIRSDRGRPLEEPVEFTFLTAPGKSGSAFTPLGLRDRPRRLPSRGPVPKVRYTFPLAGLANVFSDEVLVRFDRPMDGGTVGPATFQILDGGVPVPGAVEFPADDEGREVRFVPSSPLFPDNNYQILVTRAARSARGRYLKSEFRAGFATSPLKQGVVPLHADEFTEGPLLAHGRAFHAGNELPGGDVLLSGGQTYAGEPLASAEVFRRATATVERVGDMGAARRKHAAVTLRDGRVLACGGFGPAGTTLATAEIFNPATDTWAAVGTMSVARASHTATLLPSGRVLVAAGYTTDPGGLAYTRTAEVFNPATNTFSPAGLPVSSRGGHTATLLPDGRVLLVGGAQGGVHVAELYDPVANTFRRTLGDPLEDRLFHAASLTRSGTVLLAGGWPARAEQFLPATETFASAGACAPAGLGVAESALFPTLSLLPGAGGRLAYIGGLSVGAGGGGSDLVLQETQVWSPKVSGGQGGFSSMLFDIVVPRAAHTTTSLADGRFLVAGGFGTTGTDNERRCTIFAPRN